MGASADYLATLTRLSEAKAQAQSEAARQNGQIWGGALSNIGQYIAQIPQQQAQLKEIQNRAALTALETQREKRVADAEQRQQQAQATAAQFLQKLPKTADGLWDVNGAMQGLASTGLDPAHIESLTTGFQKLNDMTLAERKRQEEANADRAHSFLSIYKSDEPITPESMSFNAEALKAIGGMNDADAQAIHDITARVPPGTDLRPMLKAIEQKKKDYQPVYKTAAPGSTIYEERTGQTAASVPNPVADERARHDRALEDIATLTAGRAEAAAAETARHNKKIEEIQQYRATHPASAATPTGTGALTDEGVDYAATQYRVTGVMPPMGMGNSQARAAIINKAAEQSRVLGQSPAAAIQKQSAFKADASSLTKIRQMQNSAEAFKEKALGQSQIIADLSNKVARTKWPIINSALQAGRTEIAGDQDATKLANAITTFAAEYAKIMEGSTGSAAASSDSSRRAAERLINPAMNKGTITGVLDLMKREMDLTQQGYNTTIDHITSRMGGNPASAVLGNGQTPPPAPAGRFNPATGKVEPIH